MSHGLSSTGWGGSGNYCPHPSPSSPENLFHTFKGYSRTAMVLGSMEGSSCKNHLNLVFFQQYSQDTSCFWTEKKSGPCLFTFWESHMNATGIRWASNVLNKICCTCFTDREAQKPSCLADTSLNYTFSFLSKIPATLYRLVDANESSILVVNVGICQHL